MPGSERARRASIDVLLVLLTLVPLWPVVKGVLASPVGRFALQGDYAALEVQTRLVSTGGTLLGPYSRFGFNHPGPLYFYALAPVYWIERGTSTAMFLGPCLVAAASMGAIVLAFRRFAGATHAVVGSGVLLAWWAAFGTTVSVPWNPLVVVLPLVAFTVLAALVASGSSRAAPVGLLFGLFAAQTHLSCVPYVVGLVLATGVVAFVRARREPDAERGRRRSFGAAAVVLLVTSLPPLIEQVLPDGGNLSKVAKLFVARPEPPKPWGDALEQLARASAWLPERIAARSLAHEPVDPEPMWSSPFEPGAPMPARELALVGGLLFAVALVVARRRRDRVSTVLLAWSLVGGAITVVALRGIVGPPFRYLLFWTTTPSVVGLLGVATSFATVVRDVLARRDAEGRRVALVPVASGFLGLAACGGALAALRLTTAAVALRGVGHLPAVPGVEGIYRSLVARLERDGAVPVLHGGPGWHVMTALQLELVREGRPLRVPPPERWLFGRQFPAPSPGERALHLYAEHTPYPLGTKACLEQIARAGEVTLFVAPEERPFCPPDR